MFKANSFWNDLKNKKKPFFCMAPMADVTDVAFREMFARYGAPDVFWTEFVSADGLFLRPFSGNVDDKRFGEICEKYEIDCDHPLLRDLIFYESQRPIVAQFFSKDEERMEKAGALARDMGFDGMDINMGCPAKVICKQGAGAYMINTPELAVRVIEAGKRGAGDLPVSVKTRIGYNRPQVEDWVPKLLSAEIAVLILHARTRKEMSKVPANWDYVKRAVEIRDEMGVGTLIVGNGDVKSLREGVELAEYTGCDGVMVGRGIFGNPWFFDEEIDREDVGLDERLRVLREHAEIFDRELGDVKSFALMKKHVASYLHGLPNIKDIKVSLMNAENLEGFVSVIDRHIGQSA